VSRREYLHMVAAALAAGRVAGAVLRLQRAPSAIRLEAASLAASLASALAAGDWAAIRGLQSHMEAA